MFSPGGFDATIERWSNLGVYAKIRLLDHLAGKFTCIVYDRRECGQSGGRIERVGWRHFAAQGKGLLDHLKIEKAHLLGGCMGVSVAAAFAVAYPEAVSSDGTLLAGRRCKVSHHQRPALCRAPLLCLRARARRSRFPGSQAREIPSATIRVADRGPPSSSATAPSPRRIAKQDVDSYKLIVSGMGRTLVDRDTAPGAEPEDLLRVDIPALIVPGHDANRMRPRPRAISKNACRAPNIGTSRSPSRRQRRCLRG